MGVINLEKLKVGMILKNYKELCQVLEEPIKSGASKKAQLNWFEKHFTYKKEGHKHIITNIITTEVQPPPTQGGSNNQIEYTKNIEMLILDILSQNINNGKIFLSKNKLFHLLEMVNVNYLDTNRRIPKLSKFLDIDENSVQEWFDTTGGLLERSLNSALKNLANQSLIFWSREITVCRVVDVPYSEYLVKIIHKDSDGEEREEYEKHIKTRQIIEEASDNEKKFILKVERDTMLKLECDNKQEIITKGLWADFENKVKSIIKDEYDILYYFQSYKILFNLSHILEKQNEINSMLLNSNERKKQKQIVNTSVIERIEGNTQSRHNKALESLGGNDSPKLLMRGADKYIDDNLKLNETLINKKAKDIRSNVRKVRLE